MGQIMKKKQKNDVLLNQNDYQKFNSRKFRRQKFRRQKLRSIKRRILSTLLGIV